MSARFRRYSPYFQAPKKRRFTMSQDPSNKPSSSSVSRYPHAKAPLRRQIHAPSRPNLIYAKAKKPNSDCCDNGKLFTREYDHAKRTALDACREEETTAEDASSLQAYKKLMQSAERRNSKLEALLFEVLFHEKRLSQLRNPRPKHVKKPLKVPHEPFIPLTEEEEAEVYRAFSGRNRRKVLVTHESSNIDITGEVLQCLTPSAWLNDEVINLYLELLKERETREPKNYLKCHFFNTFFYKKLLSDSGYNYKAVRRWTTQRKLGYALIDCDMIFVPIHRGVHWTLAVINNRDRKFLYLDSLNGVDSKILNALAKYLGDEAKEKSGKDIDVSSWEMEFLKGIPQQKNGYDCGMFMLKYIDFFSRGLGLCFSQEHMPYFRRRTAKEILKLRAD
ncbi:Ubiquitin-like-specific protease ESD4 [Raphanus sativus]|nr:Ubiquitin-like-specific protease ESD4 [Raphanus sativus]